ncbi:MAG: NAD(P)H-hydrate epimerase [Planctomycetota bacterium]
MMMTSENATPDARDSDPLDDAPEPPLSRAAVRELDRRAIEEFGIPGLLLMENAGRGAAEFGRDLLLERMPEDRDARAVMHGDIRRLRHELLAGVGVCVLAGPGNNGGDGFVIARHLHNMGADLVILLLADRASFREGTDAATNLAICERMGLIVRPALTADEVRACDGFVHSADLVVDAMFGTGLTRDLAEPFVTGVQLCTEAAEIGKVVLAVDIPTGLCADTGRVLGEKAVRATGTATFGTLKKGLVTGVGPDHVGEIALIEIGLPRDLVADAYERAQAPLR